MSDDVNHESPTVIEALMGQPIHSRDDPTLVDDALKLIADLWPPTGRVSVTMTMDQWTTLRRILFAVPELWTEAQRG